MIRFTSHALQRLRERVKLKPAEVAELIESGKYIPLGRDDRSHRVHKLFYSRVNDQCFIVIHDEKTNEIVTIVPPDFHHRWVIDPETRWQAKELVLGKTTISATKNDDNNQSQPKPRLKLTVYLRGYQTDKLRTLGLSLSTDGEWSKYIIDKQLQVTPEVVEKIITLIKEDHLKQSEAIEEIYYRLGNKDKLKKLATQ